MEGDINTAQRNCSETGSEFDWLRLSFSLFRTFLDNHDEPHPGVLMGHLRHDGLDVNILHLEEVEHIGKDIERAELKTCQ